MTFTQLQVQSSFSLLESPLTIQQIVTTAKHRGYSAIALTDTNVMYGVVDFYREAQAAGIKPLLGMRVTAADAQLALIAETTAGYHQLLRVSSALMLAQAPLALSELPDFGGISAIVPGDYLLSEPFRAQNLPAQALFDAVTEHAPASVYLGVTATDLATELPGFARRNDLPLIALGNVRYQDPTDAFTQKVMTAIKSGSLLNLRDPTLMDAGPDWLRPPEDAAAPFVEAGAEDALEAQAALVARAQATIAFRQPQLPHYQTPNQEPAAAYLRELAQTGLAKRLAEMANPAAAGAETAAITADHAEGAEATAALAPPTDPESESAPAVAPAPIPPAYQKRLDYELSVIDDMGFADYFLVVWDVMNHAHEVGIMTGPGRGSAAGSLVSYALAITEVDPIEYDLLFERFLNPARANMPDIDLDIPDNRRAELIAYVHERYGAEHMAQIITFGTFGAKQAVRDVARVFGLSQFDSNKWSAAIPNQLKIDLRTAYAQSQPLKNLVADSAQNRALFQTALALEGLPRHDSTHAAGIVLAQQPLTDTVALQAGGEGIAQTQVPMGDVEALGLLKMDFLGLRNLSILASATQTVARQTGKSFDPKTIPLDDPETLRLFARGDTNGVFQFESAGIRNVLRRLGPTAFEDVVAVNALYRPGPMEQIPTFIARKNGRAPISYPAPALAPILQSTYGVLVYQEQVMQVASVMGGFSLGEADLLRRAMSKKKAAVIEAERVKFLAGAEKKGFDAQTAETVYAYIDQFANYGFNRSHAVAYSMIAFWLAYLKTHYPTAFFTALMNASMSNAAKLRQYVQELKQRKIALRGPDINQAGRGFAARDGAVQFGLSGISGVRRDLVTAILAARENGGRFTSLRDFLQRLDPKWLKVDTLRPLVAAGAFDRFDVNRAKTMVNLGELIESVRLAGNDVGLFDVLQPKLTQVPDWPATERLDREAEALGVYLSGHPVDATVAALRPFQAVTPVAEVTAASGPLTVVLVIRRIKRIRTKKGQEMAFLDGQDATGSLSVTIFPNQIAQLGTLAANDVVVVAGRPEDKNGVQLIANSLVPAAEAVAALPDAQVFLRLSADSTEAGTALLDWLQAHNGPLPVITVDATTRESVRLASRYWVADDATTLAELGALVGDENVAVKRRVPDVKNAEKA